MANHKPLAKQYVTGHGDPDDAAAVHVKDGEHEAVALWNLQVLLINEGDLWVAQGIQIDYVVQGGTKEEAKKNFGEGLKSTIELNLKMYGDIEGLLVFAPDEVLQEASRSKRKPALYAQVSLHEIGLNPEELLPFDGLSFFVKGADAPQLAA